MLRAPSRGDTRRVNPLGGTFSLPLAGRMGIHGLHGVWRTPTDIRRGVFLVLFPSLNPARIKLVLRADVRLRPSRIVSPVIALDPGTLRLSLIFTRHFRFSFVRLG